MQKWNICLAFSVAKEVKLNSTHYLIMKIHYKRELKIIAFDHSVDIDYKDFMKVYGKGTSEPYSFVITDTTLPANNYLRSGKNFHIHYENDINWRS